jgi:tetratricopeptide (TPR) repeat protein
VAVLALGGACLVCVFRRPALGFVLGSFWLILAPTSSIFPVYELAFEHRMYLSLAAIAVAVALAGYEAVRLLEARGLRPGMARAIGGAAVAGLVIALGAVTSARNTAYYSYLGMWGDVIAKAPQNFEAYNNVGRVYLDRGDYARGEQFVRRALEVASRSEHIRRSPKAIAGIHNNMAIALLRTGNERGAIEELHRSLALDSNRAPAHMNLGNALARTSPEAAIACYERALEINPAYAAEAHNNLGAMLTDRDPDLAIRHFEQALALDSDYADAHNNLGALLARRGQMAAAIRHFRQAIALNPDFSAARKNLQAASRKRIADL